MVSGSDHNGKLERLRKERDRLREELRYLHERFDRMAQASKNFASSMRGRTSERRRLNVQHAITRALEEVPGPEGAVTEVLKAVAHGFGQSLGICWTPDRDVLRCAKTWRPQNGPPGALEETCHHAAFPRGAGLPGGVWEEGRATLAGYPYGSHDGDRSRARMASKDGLRASFAFPVRAGGKLVWVMEFFVRETGLPESNDENLLRTLDVIGNQVGQFVERKRAEEERARLTAELTSQRALFDAVLEQMPAGVSIAEASPEGGIRHNREAVRLLGHPVIEDTAPYVPEESPTSQAILRGESIRGGEMRYRRDGSEAILYVDSAPVRDGEGRRIAAVTTFFDITERKRAEEERERLRRQEWAAQAAAAERERISRELHDRVAHEIGVVYQNLQLHEALGASESSKDSPRLKQAMKTAQSALDSARNLSAELRRSDAEDGLEVALRELVEAAVPPEMRVEISFKGDESPVPGHIRGQLYLILREAIRNAVTHSGCRRMAVRAQIAADGISSSVEDDGRGFEAERDGHGGVGLRSMRERAGLMSGELRLTSEPQKGAKVEIRIPFAGEG